MKLNENWIELQKKESSDDEDSKRIEQICDRNNWKYHSGREIASGDYPLFGFVLTKKRKEYSLQLILFHVDELNATYEIVTHENNMGTRTIPQLKIIKK